MHEGNLIKRMFLPSPPKNKIHIEPKKRAKPNLRSIIANTEELKKSMHHANGSERAYVVNELNSTCGYRNLVSTILPEKSIPILDKGRLTHILGFNGEKLWPIDYLPVDNKDKTPQDCFEAQCWDELGIVLSLGDKWMEKIKLGIFIALIVCFTIILFLISAIAMGGH